MLGLNGLDIGMSNLPLVGRFFANPYGQYQQDQFHNAALNYQAYRPALQEARMNQFAMASGMAQPLNNLMVSKWGGGAQANYPMLYQNPMSQYGMSLGAPVGGYGSGWAGSSGGGGYGDFMGIMGYGE